MGKKRRLAAAKGDPVAVGEPLALPPDAADVRPTSDRARRKRRTSDGDNATPLEPAVSHAILEAARRQRGELSQSDDSGGEEGRRPVALADGGSRRVPHTTVHSDDDDGDDAMQGQFDGRHDDNMHFDLPELSDAERSVFDKFLSAEQHGERRTLAQIIEEKIKEKQTELASQLSEANVATRQMDARVVGMYRSVGKLLATYRSGPVPKPFKVIAKMVNWEQVLALTEPENWSAAAVYQATRIFASNLNASMCQRYFNLVLLPRIRDDIDEYKKLNFHLYQALMKATFKPSAFFKGIVLPLAESGTCTLREAAVVASILTKKSVPMLHAAAAMLKLAEMDYSGANSVFLRALLDKKYTLPYRVIDGLVAHFVRFSMDKRELPVLWHQALLTFCERYKCDMSAEQRDAVLSLIKAQHHYQISAEIRRELHEADKLVRDKEQPMVTT